MRVAEAVAAAGDCFGAAGESLAVQPGVRLRPVQVFASKCLASVLPIVGHPSAAFEVACRSHN